MDMDIICKYFFKTFPVVCGCRPGDNATLDIIGLFTVQIM